MSRYDTRGAVGASRYITVDKFWALASEPGQRAAGGRAGGEVDGERVSLARLREYLDSQNFTPIFLEQGGVRLGQLSWRMAYQELPVRGTPVALTHIADAQLKILVLAGSRGGSF